jgi:hypothetical protein
MAIHFVSPVLPALSKLFRLEQPTYKVGRIKYLFVPGKVWRKKFGHLSEKLDANPAASFSCALIILSGFF